MAGFGPVGSTPVGATGSGGALPGTFVSPAAGVLSLSGGTAVVQQSNIVSKAGMAVAMRLPPGPILTKAGMVVVLRQATGSADDGSVCMVWG